MSGARARNLSFGSTVLVPATANVAPGCYLQVFRSMLQVGQLKWYGVCNVSLTFPKTSGKHSLQLIQMSDHPW